MAAKTKVEKGLLIDLLSDPDVRVELEKLIVDILGKDKGALLITLLQVIQANQSQDEAPTEKKGWFKKLMGWAGLFLPFILKFFKKK